MGGADRYCGKYRRRDETIKQQLLDSDLATRKQGMVQLAQTLCRPLAGWIRRTAQNREQSVFAALSHRNELELDDILQETLKCVWENVKNGTFTFEGSLFSYLIHIAHCRSVDRWRRLRRIDRQADPEPYSIVLPARQTGLLEDIEQFVKMLQSKDQFALRLDVKLALKNHSKWLTAEAFTKELHDQECATDEANYWVNVSVQTVRAWRVKTRKRLREFLQNRGHDV